MKTHWGQELLVEEDSDDNDESIRQMMSQSDK